ncbi:MAG: YveK family protein [Bacillota bacterium]
MDIKEFLLLVKLKRQTIIMITFCALIATLSISLLFPLRYEASSRLLISQQTEEMDAYALSRSNEYLGILFSEITGSASFYNLALETPYQIDRGYFSGNSAKQIKKWRETVKARTISDSGIVEIKVYHTSPLQAQQISLAVNEVMMNRSSSYRANDRVKISVIDQPIVSSYPIKPNLPQNAALAVIFGLIFSFFYIYIFPEEKYDWKVFGKSRSEKMRIKKEAANIAVWQSLPNQETPSRPMQQVPTTLDRPLDFKGKIENIIR